MNTITGGLPLNHDTLQFPPTHIPDESKGAFKTKFCALNPFLSRGA